MIFAIKIAAIWLAFSVALALIVGPIIHHGDR